MTEPSPRSGRPRRYAIHPAKGFAHQGAAYVTAMLDELSERLFDVISDLPQGALDYVPDGTTNSIAMLAVHMAWAEALWIARVTQATIPPELHENLLAGKQDASGDLPPFSATVEQLIHYCRAVRQEITKPALRLVTDIDVSPDGRRLAVAGREGSPAVFDAASGKKVLTLSHGLGSKNIAFSPDGKRLVCDHDADVIVRTGTVELDKRADRCVLEHSRFSDRWDRVIHGHRHQVVSGLSHRVDHGQVD